MATKKKATKKTVTKTTKKTKKGTVTTVTTTIEEMEAAPVAPKLKTRISILLDDSGSMAGCYGEAVKQVNENLRMAKAKASETGVETTVSMYLFGGANVVRCIYRDRPVAEAPELGPTFASGPSTPLVDAIGTALSDALGSEGAADENTSFLLICATDGGENSSRFYTQARMQALLATAMKTGRWTPVFMVPHGHKSAMLGLGVSADNVMEWENTRRGAEHAFNQTLQATSNYMTLRSAGVKSTEKFYATTDLSKLDKSEVKANLTDISGNFRSFEVAKEADIKTFAEEKTGRPYVLGSVFYALTKKEKVQASKSMLIMEKGKKAIWGGKEARDLLGVPVGVDVTVTPGNHAGYDVYVKSTSVNRKLVRGTKVLIDMTKTVPDAETWDSAAAKAAADAKAAAAAAAQPQT